MLSIKNKIRTSCVVQAPKYAKDESTALFLYVSCKRAHSHRFPPESFIFMFTTSFSHQAPTVTTDIWLPLFFITYGHNTSCTSSKRWSFSCIIKNQFSIESGKAPQTRILKCHFCLSMPSCWNDWINAVPGMIFLFFDLLQLRFLPAASCLNIVFQTVMTCQIFINAGSHNTNRSINQLSAFFFCIVRITTKTEVEIYALCCLNAAVYHYIFNNTVLPGLWQDFKRIRATVKYFLEFWVWQKCEKLDIFNRILTFFSSEMWVFPLELRHFYLKSGYWKL